MTKNQNHISNFHTAKNGDSRETSTNVLFHHLSSWMDISIQEKEAIRADDWELVLECQNRKSELTDPIESLLADPNHHSNDSSLKDLMTMIEKEQADIALLIQSKAVNVQQEISKLDVSSKNIKKIHGSYGTPKAGSRARFSVAG